MLWADQKDVVCRTIPNRSQQPRDQFDESPRLLKLLVFLEKRDDVFESRVERISRCDLICNRLGTTIGDLGLGCFLQFFPVCVGNVVDLGSVRQRLEKALPKDVVDFVGGEVDGGNVALGTAEFLSGIVEGAIDQGAAGLVRCIKVRDDNADVGFLAGSSQEVGKGARGNIGDGSGPDWPGCKVFEVGWELIQQDENRIFAFKQLEPCFFVRGLGTGRPEFLEQVRFAELLGDFAPEEMRRAVSAIEGGHMGASEHLRISIAPAVLLPESRILGQQTESNQQMGFASAHCLFEMEHGLS